MDCMAVYKYFTVKWPGCNGEELHKMFCKPADFANASEPFLNFLRDHFDGSAPSVRALILPGGIQKPRPLNSQWTSDKVRKWITESFANSDHILEKLGAVPSAKELFSPLDDTPAARFIAVLKDLNVEGTISSCRVGAALHPFTVDVQPDAPWLPDPKTISLPNDVPLCEHLTRMLQSRVVDTGKLLEQRLTENTDVRDIVAEVRKYWNTIPAPPLLAADNKILDACVLLLPRTSDEPKSTLAHADHY